NEIQKTIDSAKKNAISIYLSSPYPGLPEEHHRNVVVRGTVSNSKLVISVTNQITECLSDRLKLPVLKLTSTTRIPSTKWNDVIAKLSDNILKSQKLNKEGQLSLSCALDMYLQSIETDVKYDGKSLVTISAHDPGHILEVKTMLINALPINILIASNTVACKLDAETVSTLETFYSVKIGSNFGNSFGDSTTTFFGASAKRFFVGQKMALESNEGTVASMLEQRRYPSAIFLHRKSGLPELAAITVHPALVLLLQFLQRHQPRPVASFEPMTAVASSAAGYPRRQQRPESEFTMMLDPRAAAARIFESVSMPMASAAGMFEPISAAAPMLEPRATATQHFEPLATAAPIHELRAAAALNAEHFASSVLTRTTEPRFASGASALEPVTLVAPTLEPTTASLVASSPEPQVNTGSSNEPRTLLVREFMPWLPSNENLAWQWQSWQATPSSAERSRDASSSDIFGSSPESNFWNRPASGTSEPTNLTPPDTTTAMPSK
uniref:SAM domain-containing protein n=1 Tax=Macrostomum lignano TaxID=282301 RepID=A0A1I8HWL2_9PLAT